jgi:hypothetical protein
VRDRPQANTAPLARSPCRGDRFPRSMQEPRPRSRHLHAGHHPANQQAPARLIPELQSIPGFDVNLFLRHVISGSLALAFVIHTCRAHGATFPRRAPPRHLTAAARGGLRPPPAQRPRRATRPTGPAPPSPAQHRIQRLDLLHPASFNVRGTPPDEQRAPRALLAGRSVLARVATASGPGGHDARDKRESRQRGGTVRAELEGSPRLRGSIRPVA